MIKRGLKKISIVIGIIFLIGIFKSLNQISYVNIYSLIERIGVVSILISCSFYFIAHLLRAIRIAVMIGREDISLRKIISTQYYTNGVNLILPFKFGEIYRLFEFQKLIKKYQVSVAAIVAEKFIDFCFLFIGLIISFYVSGKTILNINYTFIICATFFSIIIFTCFILPNNIRALNLFIAKRYSSAFIIKVLSFTSKVQLILLNMKLILKEKLSSLLFFTVLIWIFEIFSFTFLINIINDVSLIPLLAFLVFLSIFIPSGSLGLGGIQLAFYFIHLINHDFQFMEWSVIYQLFIFLPAIITSFIILVTKKYMEYKSSEFSKGKISFIDTCRYLIKEIKRKIQRAY